MAKSSKTEEKIRLFEDKRKEHFRDIAQIGHLNNALIGLVPASSLAAMMDLARQQQASPKLYAKRLPQIENEFRAATARLTGAPEAADIALVQNTSAAISFVAHGLLKHMAKHNPGGNIVVFADEYPSNREVWTALARRYGLEVRLISPPALPPDQADRTSGSSGSGRSVASREDVIESSVDAKTGAMAISAVQYSNGYAHDLQRLGEFCRRKGIFLSIDAIQACGVMPIDVQACHIGALACGGHKWLMSPEGLGFMYIDAAYRDMFEPVLYGWRALASATTGHDADDQARPDAARFECGTQPAYLLAALNRSVAIIEDLGVNNIQRYLWGLKNDLIEKTATIDGLITALPFTHQSEIARTSPILCLRLSSHNTDEVVHTLATDYGIQVMNRGGFLRISPHIYNESSEINQLATGLTKISTN
ncbi:MAG: aminotransferase class V-fold PLP-dependent enzyme [Proteobacteria bacterium]|nr:aminotransferase class V-fold PLP-dependent enzyme [Pseudomonadota bacterium]